MIKDRLPELKKNIGYSQVLSINYDDVSTASETVPLSISGTKEQINEEYVNKEKEINAVLDEYTELREFIDEIRENIASMKNLTSELSQTFQATKNFGNEMDRLRMENMTTCQKIYTKMKHLEEDLPFKDDFRAIARIKRSNFYLSREEFLSVWKDHEISLANYEEKLKKIIMRQAKIADINVNDEETEQLIANNTTSLFVGNILEETEQSRRVLRDLMTRQTELEKIEKSLIEVRDMFLRISTLVLEQSSLIQVVEYHAQQASIKVEGGAEYVEKARELKIKGLKKKTCILIWIAVVLSILIIILIIF